MFDNLDSSTSQFERIVLQSPADITGRASDSAEIAIIHYCADYISASRQAELLAELKALKTWQQEELSMYGRKVKVPRLVSCHGDTGTAYRYSGLLHQPEPWPPISQSLRDDLNALTGVGFNSVLLNHYRSGDDYMGWHSDAERSLGPEPVIASLSLGCSRLFRFRSRSDKRLVREMTLEPGSLLVMSAEVQLGWQHMLPKMRSLKQERINMTFRRVVSV